MADVDVDVVPPRSKDRGQSPTSKLRLPSITTLLLTAYFIIGVLINGKWEPLIRRGFFCDDTSIVYPFKPNTVGILPLLLIGLIIPAIVIHICDTKLSRLLLSQSGGLGSKFFSRKRRKISDKVQAEQESLMPSSSDGTQGRDLSINGHRTSTETTSLEPSDKIEVDELTDYATSKESIVESKNDFRDDEKNSFIPIPLKDVNEYNHKLTTPISASVAARFFQRNFSEFQLFFFGCNTTMFLTGIGKVTTGRLRPNFIQRCQPNIDCSAPVNKFKYIENFNCSDKLDSSDLAYITTSWPSGHASSVFYSMLYLAIYLNTVIPVIVNLTPSKLKRRYDPLLFYAVYVLMMGLALYVASTRVSDYHHHPLDVVSGSILGALNASILAKFYLVGRYAEVRRKRVPFK